MKNLTAIVFTLFTIFNSLAYELNDFKRNFTLLPYPQQVNIIDQEGISVHEIKSIYLDGISSKPNLSKKFNQLRVLTKPQKGTIILKIDSKLDLPTDEAYKLNIQNKTITITAKNNKGLFYGSHTLAQLVQDAKEQKIKHIPALSINDYPNLAVRAVHIDVKHHLSKLDYYYNLIDRFAEVKINTIIFEFEDKLKYSSPKVAAKHAYSIEDFQKLSEYAYKQHIEISPLVQGLGHASFILKHDIYKHLRDNPKSDWAFDPLHEETYKLQFALYDDALKATPHGKYLHVGGDEVGGLGASELAKKSGKSQLELQLYWLNKVCEYAKKHNRIPIIWDDNLFNTVGLFQSMRRPNIGKDEANELWKNNEGKLNEVINLFPKECIYMRWSYHYPTTQGNQNGLAWYKKHDLKVMPATAAQASWPLIPRNQSNFKAIRDLIRLSTEYNAEGILCTVWDDASPHYETTWRGIYHTASASWHQEDITVQTYNNKFRHRFYAAKLYDDKYEFQDTLEKALVFWEGALSNKGNRANFPYSIDLISLPTSDKPGEWNIIYQQKINKAKEELKRHAYIDQTIQHCKKLSQRNHYALEIMEVSNNLQIYSSQLLIALSDIDKENDQKKRELQLKKLSKLLKKFDQLRNTYESVFFKTRIRNPEDYQLDSNGHKHLAAGTVNSDWMFVYELALHDKIFQWLNNNGKT